MKYIIIGMGQFGRALAKYLARNGFEVSILDQKEEVVNELMDSVSYSLVGDATDIRVLRQLDVQDSKVIVAIGEEFERSILVTALLHDLGAKKIYVRSVSALHAQVLSKVGATSLFRVEDVAAKQLASLFINEGLTAIRSIDPEHSLAEVSLPAEWIGKTLLEVDLRKKFRLNLVTVRRGKTRTSSGDDDVLTQKTQRPVLDTPSPDLVFEAEDELVLYGKNVDLREFVSHFELDRTDE